MSPLVMTTVNIYYSDIKPLKSDWPMMVFHGFFYMFANYLGYYDFGFAMYPIIDWKSYPITVAVFILGIGVMTSFYYCFCSWAENHWKRIGEK